jgi:hypothetical protein
LGWGTEPRDGTRWPLTARRLTRLPPFSRRRAGTTSTSRGRAGRRFRPATGLDCDVSFGILSRRGDSNSQPTVYKIPERVISGALWCGRVFSRSACVPPCDRGCRSCRGTLRGTR